MKAFKKLALVTAIAAAPFAQAELVSIDDTELSGMTGQSGISIDLSAQVSIGSIEYTDTDQAGKLNINNIVLGGAGGTGALDEIKIDIDVDATDGLIIHLGGTNASGVLTGLDKVDFGLSVGDVKINNGSNIASNIQIDGNLGPIDVVIANDGTIAVDAYFQVTSGSLDLDVLGVGVTGLTIGQDSNPFIGNLDSGTYGGPSGVAGVSVADMAAAGANTDALAASSTTAADWITNNAVDPLAPTNDETALSVEAEQAVYKATYDATVEGTLTAVESGLGGGDPLLGDGLSDFAYVGMTITTSSTSYTNADTSVVDIKNALTVSIDSMSMDIAMDVSVGEFSVDAGVSYATAGIGKVAINDLDLSGTTLKIYGH